MIVGGTGITPMIQALHAILGSERHSDYKVSMLYGSKVSNDILGQELLEKWSSEIVPSSRSDSKAPKRERLVCCALSVMRSLSAARVMFGVPTGGLPTLRCPVLPSTQIWASSPPLVRNAAR